jgi:hypothetical protein
MQSLRWIRVRSRAPAVETIDAKAPLTHCFLHMLQAPSLCMRTLSPFGPAFSSASALTASNNCA